MKLGELPFEPTMEEFEIIASGVDAIWDVTWRHRHQLYTIDDTFLVGQICVLYVNGCDQLYVDRTRNPDISH